MSIDLLVTADIRKVNFSSLMELEGNRILLPIMVDPKGDNYIEVIPHKAKAGYMTGYADPEFIESLEHLSLPFLKAGQKYRAFPIEGDSMPPHTDGSFIIGRMLEDRKEIKSGKTYILLTASEGIVYKRLNKKDEETLTLISDNTFYEPYDVQHSDIVEIWEFACSIALNDFEPDDLSKVTITNMFLELKGDIAKLALSLPASKAK